MSTNFNLFLHLHRQGRLDNFVPWRAYDIPAAVKHKHIKAALKRLCLAYAGELAVRHFMALYEVPTEEEARAVLGGWWLLTQIEEGRRPRVSLRAREATTLAGEPPTPS